MKKAFAISAVFISVLFLSTAVFAQGGGWGNICNQKCLVDGCVLNGPPLPTGQWSEYMQNGQGGVPGNALYAEGKKIWKFEGAELSIVDIIIGIPKSYRTIYEGGTFTLSLPCMKDDLVDTEVTAYNYTVKESESFIAFEIYFAGCFDNGAGICYEAVGHYAGEPILQPEGDDVLMGDDLSSITLRFFPEPPM